VIRVRQGLVLQPRVVAVVGHQIDMHLAEVVKGRQAVRKE
jgi:hypothetical protein